MIWILTEVSPSGLVASNHVIHTMHLYDIGGSHTAVTVVVVEETRKMIAGIRMYFCQFLNWVALTQTFAVIGFMKETQLFATTAKLRGNTFQFISWQFQLLQLTLRQTRMDCVQRCLICRIS